MGLPVTEKYGQDCVVRQGGLPSPNLCNLYTSACCLLFVELSHMHVSRRVDDVRVNFINYADDIALLIPINRSAHLENSSKSVNHLYLFYLFI